MAVSVAARNPKVTDVLTVYLQLSAQHCPLHLTVQYNPNEAALHCAALQSLLHHCKGLFAHDCLAEQTALHCTAQDCFTTELYCAVLKPNIEPRCSELS